MTDQCSFLELHYSLRGRTLPADHGYALYSAIKQQLQKSPQPNLPSDIPSDLRLSSIPGIPNGEGIVYLNRASRFRIRCLSDRVQVWYRFFQNQVLDIQGHLIRLVQPRIALPKPSQTLASRLVTFKLETIDHLEVPEYFLKSCQKALSDLGIKGTAFIPSDPNGNLARRTIQVKGKKVVGYRLVVEDLSAADSLKLQWHGLGGRQHFGCGWFYPVKESLDAA
ncbi:type I CRISPR immunity system RNA binding RAMP protein Cas6 [Thermosynechococcus sp. NK55a]|uniref:type I-MYXAN CRISPR-associated protein Cas6/Cmx6 n=1 Tax=unclassified Thermosynechococcus TaxID=2622553 RepID=UPI0003D90992|nr:MULTISPECIES: type I-MYXAN CRISPR-associated protein Cas6/Cmx6 [unclassified Thermosynechococcus]AHB88122.1 type I CRISPR immunity system RNA binding RAMP protein Cas6 [Thermosynechococcus sp. NK55a]RMH66399.1 MAG: type I-MYXAN CRISPR-associated protein Cas6/Cmx6 [Cyanobacteria bacterium J003]HIK23219.1 type I-MYXAN CRISPR-associated protein Cas6/Cmx6 [Thermosynechococcus sp. M3746_W2019_013]